VASNTGGFQFEGLPPADYVVRAWWRNGKAVHFACSSCTVNRKNIDLGDIRAMVGASVFVRMELQNAIDRSTVNPALVYAPPADAVGVVMVQAIPDSRLAHEQIGESLVLPLEQTFELRGIQEGLFGVHAKPAHWLNPRASLHEVVGTSSFRERVVTGKSYILRMQVRSQQRLSLIVPTDLNPLAMHVWSRRLQDGISRRVIVLGPQSVSEGGTCSILLHEGPQELLFCEGGPLARVARLKVDQLALQESLAPSFTAGCSVRVAFLGEHPKPASREHLKTSQL
jgi:hypothetical protein